MIGFLHGELGDPPGGWPEPFRTRALAGRPAPKGVTELTDDDRAGLGADAATGGATLNRLLFPGPTREFAAHRDAYGDTSVLSTKDFLYGLERDVEHTVDLEPGVTLLIELGAVSEPDARGMRTVMTTLNGQLRPVTVRDRNIAVDVKAAEKADRANPGHVAAPFAGVVTLAVESGATVEPGADGRDDRGDEDGGLDHRAAGGDGAAHGDRPGAAGGGRRPAPRAGVGVGADPSGPAGDCSKVALLQWLEQGR